MNISDYVLELILFYWPFFKFGNWTTFYLFCCSVGKFLAVEIFLSFCLIIIFDQQIKYWCWCYNTDRHMHISTNTHTFLTLNIVPVEINFKVNQPILHHNFTSHWRIVVMLEKKVLNSKTGRSIHLPCFVSFFSFLIKFAFNFPFFICNRFEVMIDFVFLHAMFK